VQATVRARSVGPGVAPEDTRTEAVGGAARAGGAGRKVSGRAVLAINGILVVALIDPFGAAALLLASLAIAIFRRSQAAERYGFGDGFLPFKRDLPWPRGVQEDDDVHFNLPGSPRAVG